MKYMYGMTNSGKLFSCEFTEWLIEAGFILSQFQMYIYDRYTPNGMKIVVLYYVLRKWFVETLGKILHVNFLVFSKPYK